MLLCPKSLDIQGSSCKLVIFKPDSTANLRSILQILVIVDTMGVNADKLCWIVEAGSLVFPYLTIHYDFCFVSVVSSAFAPS
ncbi:unnamed protein product, partial [Vitis vinifera]